MTQRRIAAPNRLQDAGFAYRYPSLESSLRHALDRPTAASQPGGATFQAGAGTGIR